MRIQKLIALAKESAYKRSITKHLFFGGSLSCAELSILTNKSVPLVTRLLNRMIEEGKVEEKGYASSSGGRRPQMYSLKPDLMYVVSVAMDQLVTRIAIVDMRNTIVGEVEKIELALTKNPHALDQLKELVETYILKSGIPKAKIAGIGIGMPGFVEVKKGANYSFFRNFTGSITAYLEAETGLPVMIDNDSSLIALAEQRLGAARNRQNAMIINISWGIGLGMVLKGELFRGNNGFAGEFSHIPLFTNNKLCSCGKRGCLETEISLLRIAEKAIEEIRKKRPTIIQNISPAHMEETAEEIMRAAQIGDDLAVELISEAAYTIGRGVAILIHLLNPELIVLSGRGTGAGRLWLAPIQQAINEHCIPKIAENTEVQLSTLGHQAELMGGAALVMENYEAIEYVKRHQVQWNDLAV